MMWPMPVSINRAVNWWMRLFSMRILLDRRTPCLLSFDKTFATDWYNPRWGIDSYVWWWLQMERRKNTVSMPNTAFFAFSSSHCLRQNKKLFELKILWINYRIYDCRELCNGSMWFGSMWSLVKIVYWFSWRISYFSKERIRAVPDFRSIFQSQQPR